MRPSTARLGSLVALVFPALLAASGAATEPVGARPVAAVQPTAAAQTVQWSASVAELDPTTGVLALSGAATVRLEQLELSARRIEARYEANAELRTLSGDGDVSVRLRDTAATAAHFDLDLPRHKLVLLGPVRISVAGGWTSAERAECDTRSGRLTLHRVQGSLPLAPAASKAR